VPSLIITDTNSALLGAARVLGDSRNFAG
jgi:hypothetical protein